MRCVFVRLYVCVRMCECVYVVCLFVQGSLGAILRPLWVMLGVIFGVSFDALLGHVGAISYHLGLVRAILVCVSELVSDWVSEQSLSMCVCMCVYACVCLSLHAMSVRQVSPPSLCVLDIRAHHVSRPMLSLGAPVVVVVVASCYRCKPVAHPYVTRADG